MAGIDDRALVAFLYLLGRDHLTLGALDSVLECCDRKGASGQFQFSNPHLARWAKEAADRLATP